MAYFTLVILSTFMRNCWKSSNINARPSLLHFFADANLLDRKKELLTNSCLDTSISLFDYVSLQPDHTQRLPEDQNKELIRSIRINENISE